MHLSKHQEHCTSPAVERSLRDKHPWIPSVGATGNLAGLWKPAPWLKFWVLGIYGDNVTNSSCENMELREETSFVLFLLSLLYPQFTIENETLRH